MSRSCNLIFAANILAFSFVVRAAEADKLALDLPYKAINFVVMDANSKRPISEGRETIVVENGFMTKNTTYWRSGDASKKTIQEETCSFELKTLRPRYYKFQNSETGESVYLGAENRDSFAEKLVYRDSLTKPENSLPFKWEPNLVFGKTLHHIIVRSWEKLVGGQHEAFQLYVPMKRDQFKFRVVKKSDAMTGDKPVKIISLEPDNWAFRQLAPSMFFHYEEKNKVPTLIHYEGPTTVVIDNKPDRKVTIDFNYES